MLSDMIALTKAGKFPLQGFGRFTVGFMGLLRSIEAPQRKLFSFVPYMGGPPTTALDLHDSLESAFVVSVHVGIGSLLAAITNTEIPSAVVQAIVILMIDLTFVSRTQATNFSVHSDCYLLPFVLTWRFPSGIKPLCVGIPKSVPLPLREDFKVFWAYLCNLPLCKRDFSVRWFWGHARVHLAGRIRPVLRTPDPFILSLAGGA